MDQLELEARFGVDDSKHLPILLRSIGLHVVRNDDEWDGGLHLIMPHSLAALALAAFGALPVLKWRFTVRMLLIAATVVAVTLGAIVAVSRAS